ncbi:MAG TPA: cupin domain-containing protein [Caulobacteraceae bacterium]|nr:cupin domain-containing protein [Caulobacteraceae bacterium]
MKKIDVAATPEKSGSSYPAPLDAPCAATSWKVLARSHGLTHFGVNLSRLPPGAWSSQRHWHSHEDEFIWVVEGELVLITDAGEETMRAGDCAAFKAGDPDGHHFVNRSNRDALILEIGNADAERDVCDYPDIDMVAGPGELGYRHRDGRPYPAKA